MATLLLVVAVAPARAGLQGMHPAGQVWVDDHGAVAEHDTTACQTCHGTDLRGTPASRTVAERRLDAEDYGQKFFWRGFQVGCFTCHLGPDGERPNPNRPAQVADVSLATRADMPLSERLAATDPDGDPLSLRIVSFPAHGTAELDGFELRYEPAPGFTGTEELTYAAWDGSTDSNLGHVFIEVAEAEPTPTEVPVPATATAPRATTTTTPTPSRRPSLCQGDCDGNGRVEVHELVRAVRIALEGLSTQSCAAADADTDGVVSVSELVMSVHSSLVGCGYALTPTVERPTPRPTSPGPSATASAPATATMMRPTATATEVPPGFDLVGQNLVAAGCTFCHSGGANAAAGLDLVEGDVYGALVGVLPSNPAARGADLRLVVPGDTERSFLLIKVTGPGPGQGSLMSGMSPSQVQTLRSWIAAGAAR